jgi:hypothetical protein
MAASASILRVVRWAARLWGTGAALFWAAFFIEHLAWFTPGAAMPPLRVWLLQGVHFIMVAALLSAWRYERAGGSIALFASVVFLGAVAGPRLWLFLALTVPPAIAFIYCGLQREDNRRRLTRGHGCV